MNILTPLFPVFALILAGLVARRRELLSAAAFQGLRDVVFFLAMPALLVSAIVKAPALNLVEVTSVYFAACLSVFALGLTLARLLGRRLARAAMLGLNAAYGNTVMIGIPFIMAAIGPDALPPLLAIIALHSILLLPLASALIELDAAGKERHIAATLATTLVATLRNPIVASILFAFVWRASRLPLPGPLAELLRLLGDCSTPLALICLGGSLPPFDRRALDAETALGVALKLTALPGLVWALGRLAHLADLPLTVAVLVGAMPTGANAFLVARRDEGLAAVSGATVVATTLLSPLSLTLLLRWLVDRI